jgi:hypothetical protein
MNMESTSCFEVERNLWRYIDRELSASELAGISSHLKLCEGCRGLYYERARSARQYRLAFPETPFGEAFVGKMVKRMRKEGLFSSSPAPSANGKARRGFAWPRLFFQRRYRRAIAIAAMLLLIPVVVLVGVVFNGSMSSGPMAKSLGTFAADGYVVLLESGRERKLPNGHLLPGSAFEVPSGRSLKIHLGAPERPDVALMALEGPAKFVLDPRATLRDFVASLDEGKLLAKVAKRPRDDSFVLRTPHAAVKVVGTRFSLEVKGTETALSVEEGKVSCRARAALPGQGTVEVTKKTGPYKVGEGEPLPLPVSPVNSTGPDVGSSSDDSEPVSPALEGTAGSAEGQEDIQESPQKGQEEDDLDSPSTPKQVVPDNLDNPVER